MRHCPICKLEYDDGGDSWKKMCYDCYKNYKQWDRINNFKYKCDLYLAHPSVTKDEIDQWIVKKGLERGWGVQEWKPENWDKFKIWVNDTNFD